ncbi:MAG: FAD-dependent oxidoreductase [Halomonas sp.]|nr:FAD-dependent oxidoreductase [Halomonas sp.]MDN6296593.1 FAD-dependent oxidoreductase [Halomonas sp.]MDN6314218.1 FAD-dependent oxidoreductase [Halomonas sp.]MDN6335099.1 FAD-dependent oxidoreductase [Halomonas sp.]
MTGLPPKELVLIGGGHAHALALEALARRPEPGVRLTVISESALAAYSGRVPAWLAGECSLEDTRIDIAALCRWAGARFIPQRAVAFSAAQREVTLASGERLRFDVASINVGATLLAPEGCASTAPQLLAMRPLAALPSRWQALCARVDTLPPGSQQKIVSVGGGAAGCETLLAVLTALRARRPDVDFDAALLSAGHRLLPGAGRLPRALLKRALKKAGVTLRLGVRASGLGGNESGKATVTLEKGAPVPADIALWATGAVGHGWLRESDLALDQRGFINVEKSLQARGAPGVFAAGDCAAFPGSLPKAGVYAVRAGPHLADNLRRACRGEPLENWQPPRRVLALINTGDGRAIASYGVLGASGKWLWRAKKRLDTRFIARFNPPFNDA